jgi:L-threonylcarbamoyladenylate synthase
LESVIGKIELHPIVKSEKEMKVVAKSPGMKYRHYAPEAQVIVVEGEYKNVKKRIDELLDGYKKTGKREDKNLMKIITSIMMENLLIE